MQIIHTDLVKDRFSRSFVNYNQEAVVQKQIAARMGHLLQGAMPKRVGCLLEIGCGTGFLTHQLVNSFLVEKYYLNDLAENAIHEVEKNMGQANFTFVAGDAEVTASLPGSLDAIVSSSTFQWFKNIALFFRGCTTLLNPDGMLAFATFGPKNFEQIWHTLHIGLHYQPLNQLLNALGPYFHIIHAEEWQQSELFASPAEVLRHIKLTGVNGIARHRFSKARLLRFGEEYCSLFSKDGCRVELTYHPIIIIAKKK
ncbi:MAG: malonyl-ACP O-methyltransferase BioC [Bacteroidales bacterium]|nr:malonyl-ACP O-methyltransferase BioC [Bacteroidales bacterium]